MYVGATNTILQLTSDLNVLNSFISGPGNDSDRCGGPPRCDSGDVCQSNLRCRNNYNQILIPYREHLLACGTLQAVCTLLQLNNVSQVYRPNMIDNLQCKNQAYNQEVSISSRSTADPIVAAIHTNNDNSNGDAFYLGKPGKFIQVLYAPNPAYNFFTLVDEFPSNFMANSIRYHLAWTTPDYGYVLWTNTTTEVTKVSRYCNQIMEGVPRRDFFEELMAKDVGKSTYTEIPLRCQGYSQPASNVISARFVFNQLFVLFRKGSTFAICVVDLQPLNRWFNSARELCFGSNPDPSQVKLLLQNCTLLGSATAVSSI